MTGGVGWGGRDRRTRALEVNRLDLQSTIGNILVPAVPWFRHEANIQVVLGGKLGFAAKAPANNGLCWFPLPSLSLRIPGC